MFFSTWLALATGCAPSLPEPTLEGVAPTWGWNGETTDITVVGTNLLPGVYAYADTRDEHRIYDDFQIDLVGVDDSVIALTGEDLETYRALSAQVPAGHPVGTYDLRLTSPGGETATLADAFTVTETRADHLDFLVEDVAFEVHQTAVFGVLLADPDGQPVGEDLVVEVRADPEQGADGAVFDLTGLDNISALDDGVGVSGRLGSDGEAYLSVTSQIPGGLRLSVEPADPDSLIRGDEVFFDFAPGPVNGVTLTLPSEDFTAIAGQAFPVEVAVIDEFGNPVDDVGTDLVIEEVCGTLRQEVTVVGSQSLQLAVTGATDSICEQNQLLVSGGASGASEPFETVPGPPAVLRVLPAAETATAGVPYPVFVWAEDAWGNTLQDYTGEVLIADSESALASFDCEDGAIRYCTLTFTVAVSSTVLLASDDLGAVGDSDPITVEPGPPTELTLGTVSGPLEAGTPFTLSLSLADSFGNPAVIDPLGDDPFTVDDGAGPVACSWLEEPSPGTHSLECVTTTAAESAVFEVQVASRGLTVSSDPVEVVNGALAVVAASASPTSVTAGESFTLSVSGSDAWGNPYETQSDPVVDVADGAGSLSPVTLTLGPDGTGTGTFAVTTAGDPVTLVLSQAGVTLGQAAVVVAAATVDTLDVSPERGWGWVDDTLDVTVQARDGYGNPVLDFAGPVLLTSQASGFVATPLSGFSQGAATASLSWEGPVLQDVVDATADTGPSGSSDPVDLVDGACADGPTAVLTLDGVDEAVACRVAGLASVSADFSDSTATAGVVAWHLDDGQGQEQRHTGDTTTLTSSDEGRFEVGLLAVDADACGHETSGSWWSGDADGEPVGPVTLSSSHSQRTAGSTTNGQATIQVDATTCSGDVASGGTVLVRADLGEVSGLTSTGQGLSLVLDSAGSGSFTFSVETQAYAGTATVLVGTADGASLGTASLAITGDSARPTVADLDPSGETAELLDEVVVVFTEPLNPSTATSANVSLEGPDGAETFSAVSLDTDDTRLVLTLDETVDTSAGTWTLTLTSSLRDDDGNNRLDGGWTGSSGDFTALFGDVGSDGLSTSACSPSTSVITPDGDDGAGDEAEGVVLAAEASGTPAWWELEVLDSGGGRVRTTRVAGSANTESLTWDGRADDGRVAGADTYTVMISTFDGSDNQSTSCETEVTLSQRVRSPE